MPRTSSKATPPTSSEAAAAHEQAASDHGGHGPHAGCGCELPGPSPEEGRRAQGVDPDAKTRNLKRLRRIEGQVRGLQKMVESERYCADILTQISSVHEALRAVGRELMRNHLKHCASSAIRAGEEQAGAMYDELIELIYKHSR
jgi:CsoR family transcriptional regulator, copper-sensing transcriptional repressor